MRRELHTRRLSRLRRHSGRDVAMVAIAALALIVVVWILASRKQAQPQVVTAAAPTIVTVPVPIAVREPAPPTPAPPAPVPSPTTTPPVHDAPAARQPRIVAPTAQPPHPPVTTPTGTDITTQYRQVGALLKQHPDDGLWQRYRWIRLGDCLMTPEQRSECARMLDEIASAARGK